MAGNWTPGPWLTKVFADGALHIMVQSDDLGSISVARITQVLAEAPDNARLISAAPDLYEALENAMGLIIAWGATYQVDHGLSEMHPTHAATVNEAQAALARARGDQPDSDPPIPNSATHGA